MVSSLREIFYGGNRECRLACESRASRQEKEENAFPYARNLIQRDEEDGTSEIERINAEEWRFPSGTTTIHNTGDAKSTFTKSHSLASPSDRSEV